MIRVAKLHAKIYPKAQRVLVAIDPAIRHTVAEPTPGDNGRYFCIVCGNQPPNNTMALGHSGKPGHRLAWLSFDYEPARLEVIS